MWSKVQKVGRVAFYDYRRFSLDRCFGFWYAPLVTVKARLSAASAKAQAPCRPNATNAKVQVN